MSRRLDSLMLHKRCVGSWIQPHTVSTYAQSVVAGCMHTLPENRNDVTGSLAMFKTASVNSIGTLMYQRSFRSIAPSLRATHLCSDENEQVGTHNARIRLHQLDLGMDVHWSCLGRRKLSSEIVAKFSNRSFVASSYTGFDRQPRFWWGFGKRRWNDRQRTPRAHRC